MECTDDSEPVICYQRPVELYGKVIWKPCLFGYICIKKTDYSDEFPRCIDLPDHFRPILCNSAYEYPHNFNCDFYEKFACHRGKHYIYSCVCINSHRNVDMMTCANATVCANGLPEKQIPFITATSEKTTAYITPPYISSRRTPNNRTKPRKKYHPKAELSTLLQVLFPILSILHYYFSSG